MVALVRRLAVASFSSSDLDDSSSSFSSALEAEAVLEVGTRSHKK
jgi:hypothetical protein